MTPFQWFQAAQFAVMSVAGVIVWVLLRGFQAGRWTQSIDHGPAIKQIESRLERGSGKMSELASEVNGLPERLRKDFMPREESEWRFAENAGDRQRLWEDNKRIWTELDRLKLRRNPR